MDLQLVWQCNFLVSKACLAPWLLQRLPTTSAGACPGFLKGVGEDSARSAGSEATAAGARGAAPGKF